MQIGIRFLPHVSEVDKLRFLTRFAINQSSQCWEWQANRDRCGYGKFILGRETLAHRASWMIFKGGIPDGLYVCHRCDNRPCVNPSHLILGDQLFNMRDCISKDRLKPPFGERVNTAKLEEQDVIDIRLRFKAGESFKHIARSYVVTEANVRKAAVGINWKHIPL